MRRGVVCATSSGPNSQRYSTLFFEDTVTLMKITLPPSRQLRFRLLFTALAVLLSCLMLPSLWAQSDTGNIAGTVMDSTGAVIQSAAVTATNAEPSLPAQEHR
jgi:hypothetical protein